MSDQAKNRLRKATVGGSLRGIRPCLRHTLLRDGSLRSALFPAKRMPQTRPGKVTTFGIGEPMRSRSYSVCNIKSELLHLNTIVFFTFAGPKVVLRIPLGHSLL